MSGKDPGDTASAILEYWFATLDDATALDPEAEPFRTCYARWYGKRPELDAEIRARFEPVLEAVVGDGREWDRRVEAWRRVPNGLLALLILLDQFPRNMYRDTPAMYAYDPLALAVVTLAMPDYEAVPLPLVQRMFLYVPLMHVENVTLQQAMAVRFESLAEAAKIRSPHNVKFFEFALGYAKRHLEVVLRFGRFPHRNAILGRHSTPEETEFLKRDDSRF